MLTETHIKKDKTMTKKTTNFTARVEGAKISTWVIRFFINRLLAKENATA
jgi:hypothetical protein